MCQETHVKKVKVEVTHGELYPQQFLESVLIGNKDAVKLVRFFHEEFNGKDFTCTGKHSVGDIDKAG